MAGDWIKMRNDLPDDPAVIAIAVKLGIDEFAVIGRLHSFWVWVDEQSRDGHAAGVTCSWLNRKVQRDGFAEALADVGWLVVDEHGLTIPNFDRHNGDTAKTRALGTRRKQRERALASAGNVPEFVTSTSLEMSRSERDKSVTREEKRRDKEIPPNPPRGAARRRASPPSQDDRFEEFWTSYPRKTAKQAAVTAWAKLGDEDRQAAIEGVQRWIATPEVMRDAQRERGRFLPHPATWLNGRRWEDERSSTGDAGEAEHGDRPLTTAELARRHPRPAWLEPTGFTNLYEAESDGCFPHTAHLFRNGERVKAETT